MRELMIALVVACTLIGVAEALYKVTPANANFEAHDAVIYGLHIALPEGVRTFPAELVPLPWRAPARQPNDARPAVAVAARTLHIAERHTNGCLRVTRLHAQIQINNGAATVAGNSQPVMLWSERGCNLGPEPNIAFSGKRCVESAHGCQCPALRATNACCRG